MQSGGGRPSLGGVTRGTLSEQSDKTGVRTRGCSLHFPPKQEARSGAETDSWGGGVGRLGGVFRSSRQHERPLTGGS